MSDPLVPTIVEVPAVALRQGDRVDEAREVVGVYPCCGRIDVTIGRRLEGVEVAGGAAWTDTEDRTYRPSERVRVARLVEPPQEVDV